MQIRRVQDWVIPYMVNEGVMRNCSSFFVGIRVLGGDDRGQKMCDPRWREKDCLGISSEEYDLARFLQRFEAPKQQLTKGSGLRAIHLQEM